jgi:hypothetical protein
VRENRPPGSVRGAPGNRRPYRDPAKGLLETESAELEKQASQLAKEIKELTGEKPTRIS